MSLSAYLSSGRSRTPSGNRIGSHGQTPIIDPSRLFQTPTHCPDQGRVRPFNKITINRATLAPSVSRLGDSHWWRSKPQGRVQQLALGRIEEISRTTRLCDKTRSDGDPDPEPCIKARRVRLVIGPAAQPAARHAFQ